MDDIEEYGKAASKMITRYNPVFQKPIITSNISMYLDSFMQLFTRFTGDLYICSTSKNSRFYNISLKSFLLVPDVITAVPSPLLTKIFSLISVQLQSGTFMTSFCHFKANCGLGF